MAASVECRQEEMSCGVTKEKEKGDDLSLFVDFNGANLNIDLHKKSNQFQEIFDSESENSIMQETRSIIIHGHHPAVADDLLNSENTTTDYDWLLSPPRNSVPSPEMEEQKALTSQHLISNGQTTSPKSRQENTPLETITTTKVSPKLPSSSIKSSNATIRRPSPSRKPPSTVSRSTTPTTRPTIPSTTKPSRSSTPTSRPTIPATKPPPPSKRSTTPTRPARSSTPTARPSILPASKPTSRSSTPTPRPSIIATSKSTSTSTSRSSTPTQRATISSVNITRSTSVTKARAPPSIKKSLPERPASASRGRPEAIKPIPKRTSSSPSRGPVSNGVKTGVMRNRGYSNGNDDVNPVLMGTKMVERVVNMRKLAPPREDRVVNQNNTSGKLSVSQDNSGFGRTLSKKSFDMALRHLDIRRSMPGNMRAMITKIPASSVYSVRSESAKNHSISASDSPLATSSSASSDHSITNNPSFIDATITNGICLGFENGH